MILFDTVNQYQETPVTQYLEYTGDSFSTSIPCELITGDVHEYTLEIDTTTLVDYTLLYEHDFNTIETPTESGSVLLQQGLHTYTIDVDDTPCLRENAGIYINFDMVPDGVDEHIYVTQYSFTTDTVFKTQILGVNEQSEAETPTPIAYLSLLLIIAGILYFAYLSVVALYRVVSNDIRSL